MEHDPLPVPGETRDWTFVLQTGCPECAWRPAPDVAALASAWNAACAPWPGLVTAPGAAERERPLVWSTLEYGVHSRDMIRLLGLRITSMLTRHDPEFGNWDGDTASFVRRDWATDPQELAADLELAGAQTAAILAELEGEELHRRGHRTDGVPFSVLSLWQYTHHDVFHHLWDVGAAAVSAGEPRPGEPRPGEPRPGDARPGAASDGTSRGA